MTDFEELLSLVHQIQGASDPNHPLTTDRERLDEIHELTSAMMRKTGWTPPDEHHDTCQFDRTETKAR